MKLLEIIHPAAKLLVEIARSQDSEVGDGTTSVVLLAGELLNQVRPLIEDNVNPQVIIKGFRSACEIAKKRVQELAIDTRSLEDWRSVLERCASTSMNSKIICHQKDFFKRMVVDAVLALDQNSLNERMIGIKKVPGGALQDSMLVMGVAFKRTFHYAGFEQQPRKILNPSILCLNLELELKAERANAEVRVSQVQEYQAVVDAEWAIIYEKLDKIAASGANVVLSRLPIGDLATQYFADRGIFCAGRVASEDLERVTLAVGGAIQSSVNDLLPTNKQQFLGTCGCFEEVQIGAERYNLFTQCQQAKTCTMILRGGSEQFISEVERSLHDAVMITKRVIRFPNIVAGGGALEMEVSRSLKEYANSIEGKQQLVIGAFAKAFEVIPRQLSDNCGLDTPAVMNKLRRKHAVDGVVWAGVDVTAASGVGNNYEKFVWEPALVKTNMISAATEAAVMILSVDETVKAPVPQDKNGGQGFR